MMVSTDEEHHFANSGTTLPDYWDECKRCIAKAKDVGIKRAERSRLFGVHQFQDRRSWKKLLNSANDGLT